MVSTFHTWVSRSVQDSLWKKQKPKTKIRAFNYSTKGCESRSGDTVIHSYHTNYSIDWRQGVRASFFHLLYTFENSINPIKISFDQDSFVEQRRSIWRQLLNDENVTVNVGMPYKFAWKAAEDGSQIWSKEKIEFLDFLETDWWNISDMLNRFRF